MNQGHSMSYIALIKGNELSIFCLTQGLGFEGVGGTALHKLILGPKTCPGEHAPGPQ